MKTRGVALAGFMGVGKSTVGEALAARVGLPFCDLDAEISSEAGRPVADLFALEGEQGFREREARAVARLVDGPRVVLALGGGTLHHGDNLARLKQAFFVVSLEAPLDVIETRVGAEDLGRPLWREAATRFSARAEGYRKADACVAVGRLTVPQAVDAVMGVLPCG